MKWFGNRRVKPFLIPVLILSLAVFAAVASHLHGQRDISALARLPGEAPGEYTFLVVSDTHGHGEFFTAATENEQDALFIIHLGDFTASGAREQYSAFLEQCKLLSMPVLTVPGNHDVKNNGAGLYNDYFGPANRSFTLGGIKYVLCDTSDLSASEETLRWLDGQLDGPGKKVLFTHVPPRDPPGGDHSFIDERNAGQFIELLARRDVDALFSGHVHCYSESTLGDMLLIVSGGGGGPLYAGESEGGFHHYLRVRVTGDEMKVEAVPLEISPVPGELVVQGKGSVTFSLEELQSMTAAGSTVGFENKFGNVSGQGTYSGVPVGELIEQAGGMEPLDVLVVHSLDGFSQAYSYQNVYPPDELLQVQGEMIVANGFNGRTVPEWTDGLRIAFLPADGLYSNEDCAATSAPGQGWHVYESAGARWARNVVRIEVLPCNNN